MTLAGKLIIEAGEYYDVPKGRETYGQRRLGSRIFDRQ